MSDKPILPEDNVVLDGGIPEGEGAPVLEADGLDRADPLEGDALEVLVPHAVRKEPPKMLSKEAKPDDLVAAVAPADVKDPPLKKRKIKNPLAGKLGGGKLQWPAFFVDDGLSDLGISNEKEVMARHARLLKALKLQTWIVFGIVLFLLLVGPMLRPVNNYFAVLPDVKLQRMIPLNMSNQTNKTVMSWAATSITDVWTFGFGDFDERILSQRHRFTADGWTSFIQAILRDGLNTEVKQRQLVLTSVPADAPVITSQGVNKDEVYQWVVEMPIIMTFGTNNNVTQKRREIIKLTIVRVPSYESKGGIAIKNWGIGR